MNKVSKILIGSFVWICLFSFSSCVSVSGSRDYYVSGTEAIVSSGKIVTKNVAVKSDFNVISVPDIIDVVVKQGNNSDITIKGSDNIVPYCNVSIQNGTLTVSLTKEATKLSFKKFDAIVYVTAKEISQVVIQGTGDVKFEGEFNSPELSLLITGTGDIKIPHFIGYKLKAMIPGTGGIEMRADCVTADLTITGTGDIDAELKGVEDLRASVPGTGDITLYGDAKKATYTVSGTGDIGARKMIVGTVHATSSGTGDIDCYATDYFHGIQSATAKVKCHGNPKKMDMIK